MNIELEKIETRIKKVILTSSLPIEKHSSKEDLVKHLLFNAVMTGASINSFNAVLENRFSGYDINEILFARERIKEILDELEVTIGLDERKIKKFSHKFI